MKYRAHAHNPKEATLPKPENSREWNASEYDRLSAPQFQWGQRVLSRLPLRGDECLLDAGCGTGRLTRLLHQNLPEGHVVGLDLSRNMVQHARQNLALAFGARLSFVVADLIALPFCNRFDGIFSTAAFHWVLDHDALFRSLFESLRSGGWLRAQCGGGSNIELLRMRVRALSRTKEFSDWLGEYPEPWFFSDADSAKSRLRFAGFVDVEADLEQANFTATSEREFQQYLRTFVLHRHLERLPTDELRTTFVEQLSVLAGHDNPPWTLDYCRLNLRARKME